MIAEFPVVLALTPIKVSVSQQGKSGASEDHVTLPLFVADLFKPLESARYVPAVSVNKSNLVPLMAASGEVGTVMVVCVPSYTEFPLTHLKLVILPFHQLLLPNPIFKGSVLLITSLGVETFMILDPFWYTEDVPLCRTTAK